MTAKLNRFFAATTLATAAAATGLSGCASLNAQNLPDDSCGKAGVVPVKVAGARPANTFIAKDGTRYGLMDMNDPVLGARHESAAAGAGIGAVAAKVLKFNPWGGAAVGLIAGAAIGSAEGGASKTANMRACFAAVNKGAYADEAITVEYTGQSARFVNAIQEQRPAQRAAGFPAWIYENGQR